MTIMNDGDDNEAIVRKRKKGEQESVNNNTEIKLQKSDGNR